VNVHNLLSHYGYAAVFVLVFMESLGVPLPGETILIAAAIYAGTTHHLSIWLVFVVAAAAAVTGPNVGFWVGDRGGYRLLRKYGRYIRVDERKVKIGRYVFDRQGPKVVFFGRFVAVLRTYAAFLAGTLKMRWLTFFLWNSVGAVLWAAVYSFVPYEIGNAINKASKYVDIGIGIAALVVIVAAVLLFRRQAGRIGEKAEAAYPGPLPEH
jgi:membrane protein DedA with SNARE-associated domain